MYLDKNKVETNVRDRCHSEDYNKKQGCCQWRAGYFTLEASLVVPMALCIIVLLIHLSYYTYQKAILTQDLYLLGFRASVLGRQQEVDADTYIRANAADQFGNRYIGSPEPEIDAQDNDRFVKCHAETEADHAAMQWHFLMPASDWGVRSNSKADVIHRGAHIRRIDRLVDLGKIALNHVNGQ